MKNVTQKHAGLSLVELLISIVIGLFIITGVIRVLIDSKNSYLLEEETAYIQENARFLNDQLLYDLRLASFVGCPLSLLQRAPGDPLTPRNSLANQATTPHFSSLGVRGHNEKETSYAAGTALPTDYTDIAEDSDIFVVNYAEKIDGVESLNHDGGAVVNFIVDPNIGPIDWGDVGDVMVIADGKCDDVGIFQQTTTGPSVGFQPDNLFQGAFLNDGSTLYRYRSHGYYVRAPSPTKPIPSLNRVVLTSGGNIESQELLSGVEDMDIFYGIYDATASPPTIQYQTSDEVGTSDEDWRNVVSVHAIFVLRSSRPVFGVDTDVDLGQGYTFKDRFLRQLVTISTNLRNN